MNKYHSRKLTIAIVHDSIRYYGGAERVVEVLMEVWPDASLFMSSIDWEGLGKFRKQIERYRPKTSWVQRVPFFSKYPYFYRYLLPFIWRSLDFSDYDVVISSSGAQMSHLISVPKNVLHICYSHTPPRHLYGLKTDFDWERSAPVRFLLQKLNNQLQRIDFKVAQRVDYFIANSDEVARRIKRIYNRDAAVIYPPLTEFSTHKKIKMKGDYYLAVSRLSRMKNVDVIIQACLQMERELCVVGRGPEEKRLKRMAGSKVRFVNQVSDEQLGELYTEGRAVICAGEDEDFGIVPIEAMSFGKPVIAYWGGGYKETVVENETGVFFRGLTTKSLIRAMKRFEGLNISSFACVRQAKKFSKERFKREIREYVMNCWIDFSKEKS